MCSIITIKPLKYAQIYDIFGLSERDATVYSAPLSVQTTELGGFKMAAVCHCREHRHIHLDCALALLSEATAPPP